MLGITHCFIGSTAAIQAAYLRAGGNPSPLDLGAAILAAGIGSLLPDIDEDHSSLRLMLVGDPSKPKGCLVSIAMRLLTGGHRKATHLLDLAGGLVCLPALILFHPEWFGLNLPWWLVFLREPALYFALSYVLHLLVDLLTIDGVPMLLLLGGTARLPAGLRLRSGFWLHELTVCGLCMLTLWAIYFYGSA